MRPLMAAGPSARAANPSSAPESNFTSWAGARRGASAAAPRTAAIAHAVLRRCFIGLPAFRVQVRTRTPRRLRAGCRTPETVRAEARRLLVGLLLRVGGLGVGGLRVLLVGALGRAGLGGRGVALGDRRHREARVLELGIDLDLV